MFTSHTHLSTSWKRRRLGAGLVATTLVAIGLPLTATSASAAGINNPPVSPRLIAVFPGRDFVSASGYAQTDRPIVQVVRQGFVVAHTLPIVPQDDPKTDGFDGMVDVNHGTPEPCFVGSTPNIQPGDAIRVLTGAAIGDETITANVTVTQPATMVDSTTVTLKGFAIAAIAGGQIPISQLEARVVANQQQFVKSGTRTVRADATGNADGILAYDFPGTTNTAWTATFTGMGQVNPTIPGEVNDGLTDAQRAVSPLNQSRGMWNGANPVSLTEQTIFEFAEAKGPGIGCPPAAAGPTMPDMTVTTDTGFSSTDNITRNPKPAFGGLSVVAGATSVNLYVDGVLNGAGTITGGVYSVAPTTPLTNGPHTVKVQAVTAGTPEMSNASLAITIDTAIPTVITKIPAVDTLTASQIGNLSATFGENVTGVTNSTFALRRTSTNGLLTASVSYNWRSHIATLNPATTLLPSTAYTATLSSSIKDLAGNPLTATSWSFKTGPVPIVMRVGPPANTINVKRLANVAAIFSEPVSGVSRNSFALRKTSTGGLLTIVVGYNSATKIATLNPSTTLLPNTRYSATLSTLIKDADGNSIAVKVWTFTTGAS